MELTFKTKTFIERSSDWVDIAHKLAIAQKERKEADKKEAFWAAILKNMSEGQSSKGGRFMYEKIMRKGSIAYKDIPMLQNIDLEPWRGEDTESWKLTIEIE